MCPGKEKIMAFKPMLADDWIPEKVKFPIVAQPKVDGVRALNVDGKLVGRSLKPHGNVYVGDRYSIKALSGLDGEMYAGTDSAAPDLCRSTTSALNTHTGWPHVSWMIFDYHIEEALNKPYLDRLKMAGDALFAMRQKTDSIEYLFENIWIVPCTTITDMDQLIEYETQQLELGYEGVVFRDPKGTYKQGRSTPTEGGLARIKRFRDAEARITQVLEGETNLNEAQVNELGHTFRSTHKHNMVPNGMVGKLIGIDLISGKEVTISPGKMTHAERKLYFEQPELIIGKISKYKHFPHGAKDKPRFPIHLSIRPEWDL